MQLDLPHVLMPGSLLHGSTLQCRQASRTVSIQAPSVVLRALYDFDGVLTPRRWLDSCRKRQWDLRAATALLQALIEEKVLVCIHDVARQLWSHAENPRTMGEAPPPAQLLQMAAAAQTRLSDAPGAGAITLDSGDLAADLHRLLRERVSGRSFGPEPLSPKVVTAVLWAAAGVVRDRDRLRSVTPSAGALYPLRHYYLNLRTTGALNVGAYSLSAGDGARLHYTPLEADLSSLQAAFSSPDLLDRAQGILVIAAQFADSARKYGPRALSYVPLEAGHAAQNALLAATACDCQAVEIGGFLERDLAALLGCGDDIVPVTTVILGSRGAPEPTDVPAEFEWVDARDSEGVRAFFLCRARQDALHPWSWGRDTDAARARLKATMESRERAALCSPQGLVKARLQDLPNAMDPRDVLRYGAAQYRRAGFPYRPFDPRAEYLWKAARNVLEDSPCFMLADLIYLEEGLAAHNRPSRYTSANTSGAAAHTCAESALENAVLELIERDAFMRLWLGVPAIAVQEQELPAAQQARLHRLRSAGMRVVLRDIGHAYCPVAFCFAQSMEQHFTRVASCAGYDFEAAMDHALMELEAQVYIMLHNPKPPPIRAAHVRDASDHATLYSQKSSFRRADALAAPADCLPAARDLAQDWPTLTQLLRRDGQQLIAVDLSDGAPLGTPTIKAFIPGLIPIKFGAGNEPAGQPAYLALRQPGAKQRRGRAFPHPFN
ncbi:YcaO-like family protein [Achromobacter deleyi]|uniref:YcaO-like family protein n=1 Tax=Achromobacter deleyi TaxID=1353891 RepID=UPI0014914317|nr:YcaO-like family protein [Achromobacter deleyi]QVQ26161.1 YcaO-like family protein [Achromobacter deleyi]UIP21723.1 YcaO-like family protein [Achromobacter deleyi]